MHYLLLINDDEAHWGDMPEDERNAIYGEYTRSSDVTAGTAMARVEAMEIPGQTIDGNDVWAVREAVGTALEGVRGGEGPAFVEALTYRFVGHSRSDPGKYRPEGELDSWRERDPLKRTRERLALDYVVSDDALDQLEAEVEAELEAVRDVAIEAPFPDPAAGALTEFK